MATEVCRNAACVSPCVWDGNGFACASPIKVRDSTGAMPAESPGPATPCRAAAACGSSALALTSCALTAKVTRLPCGSPHGRKEGSNYVQLSRGMHRRQLPGHDQWRADGGPGAGVAAGDQTRDRCRRSETYRRL